MPRCPECGAVDLRWLAPTRVWECPHCGHQMADPAAPAMMGVGDELDDSGEGDASPRGKQ